MNKKYIILDESIKSLSKEDVLEVEANMQNIRNEGYVKSRESAKKIIQKDIPFKAPKGRVIVKVDLEYKNSHKFEDGTEIYIGRDFNNLNRRETMPVNAIVIDAEHIPSGAEVLIHHNACHDTYKIFDYEDMVEGEVSNDIQYFSIKESDCFLWRKDTTEWQPCTVFDTALRVFKPYIGTLENIPSTKIKDTLFVTSGNLKGKCVSTPKSCDYEIVFNDLDGKEHRIIRFRPFGDEENQREPEAICLLNDLTEKINNGELLVGLNESDCKMFHESHK